MLPFLTRRRSARGRVLSPFDFLRRYPAQQKIAIAGNAPSLSSSHNGALIDESDVVVRFNGCSLDGFESGVGSRTDILAVSQVFGVRGFSQLEMDSVGTILAINNCFSNDLDEEAFWNAAGPADAFFSFCPSLMRLPDPAHDHGLTTGTRAIHLLGQFLQPKELFITGFTLFLDPGANDHYYEERKIEHQKHDLVREREIFCQVLNSLWCRTTVTPDVAALFAATGIRPQRRIQFVDWNGSPAGRILDNAGELVLSS